MFKKLSKYLPQIVAMLFLAGFVVWAWTEPSQAPPLGNVEAPINVSTTSQYKAGALGIGGLLRGYSDAIFDGNVGIGTTNPGAKLDIQGGDVKVGGATIKGNGSVSTNLNADKLDDQHASELRPPTGLYGWCQQGVPGTYSAGQCSARAPSFCQPPVFGTQPTCECLSGYEKLVTGYSDTYAIWYMYISCYKP